MQNVPNTNLYITRKRKKWKFAHFDSYPNCFTFLTNQSPSGVKSSLKSYFKSNQPLILELAAGNAQFGFQLAKLHPEYNFIAVDIKSDRLYTSAKQALEEGVVNIAFLRMNIHQIDMVFAQNSIAEIWLTFPDPFMRKRSVRRRLSHQLFLQKYRKILQNTGNLRFKTDNRDLFLWSLEQFVADKWNIHELSFDLHESDLSKMYKIMTYYEQRFVSQGIPINFCSVAV